MSIEALTETGACTDYGRYGISSAPGAPHDTGTTPPPAGLHRGLENRWHRAFSTLPTYDEALFSVKTKRYAFSRLCRMGAYTVLQPSQDFFDKSYREGPQYGRILAFNERGAAFLKEIKGPSPS